MSDPTPPPSGDIRNGIRDWADDSGMLGNAQYGDCVIAAFEQLRKCHEVANGSNWKKILWRLGFKPPHTKYAIEIYAEYLATLGEKPSPTNGVDPGAFLTWAQSKGMVSNWGQITSSAGPGQLFAASDLPTVESAMLAHDGCILTVTLTPDAYQAQAEAGGHWTYSPTDPNQQPKNGLFHAIAMVAYSLNWITAVTWCFQVYISPQLFSQFCWGAFWFDLPS
jgi:hypothetical protein